MSVELHTLPSLCFRAKRTRGMHDTSYQSGRYVRRTTRQTTHQNTPTEPPNVTGVWADLQVELLGHLAADLLHLNTTLPSLRGSVGREPLSVDKVRAAIAQLQNPYRLPVGVLLDPMGLHQLRSHTEEFAQGDVRLLVVDTPYFPAHEGVLTGAVILLPETEAAHKATFHCVAYPYHTAGFSYPQEIRFPWGSLWGGYREGRELGKIEFRLCSGDLFFVAGEGVSLPYSS